MPAQKKRTNCVLCGVSLAAYPKQRTYCPTCARRANPTAYKPREERRKYERTYAASCTLQPGQATPRPKYTGPSVAEIDAEAQKLGVSCGKYVLMLHQGRI